MLLNADRIEVEVLFPDWKHASTHTKHTHAPHTVLLAMMTGFLCELVSESVRV